MLAACSLLTEPETGARAGQQYAVLPLTLSPNHHVMTINEFLNIRRPWYSPESGPVHNSYITNSRPKVARCIDGGGEGLLDCLALEREGWVVIGVDRANILFAEFGCGRPARVGSSGPRVVTIGVTSCFGLTRWQHFWDSTGVEFIPNRTVNPYMYRPLRCGSTWAAYRLKAQSGGGTGVTYPLDEVFSDTVWMDVVGC